MLLLSNLYGAAALEHPLGSTEIAREYGNNKRMGARALI